MSEEIKERLTAFFDRMLSTGPYQEYAYKALFSRGCLDLYGTVADGLAAPAAGTLMTDGGLLARAAELAGYRRDHGAFPDILLLDGMVHHGRALVSFLSALERQLTAFLPGMSREDVRHGLSKAVRIESFVSCGKPAFLYEEYHAGTNRFSEGRCDIREFRRQSRDLAAYIAESGAAGAAYAITARLPRNAGTEEQVGRCIGFLEGGGYRSYRFSDGTRAMLKCFPDPARPKAIFSVRILERGNSYRIVPHIFTAEYDRREFRALTGLLARAFDIRFRGGALPELDGCPRVQCELAAMMLDHLLLRHALDGAGLSGYVLDSWKPVLNFGGDRPSRDFLDAFLEKVPAAAGAGLREFTEALPGRELECPPPGRTGEVLDLGTTKAVLERYIYSWGIRAERVAHLFGTGGLTREIAGAGSQAESVSACLRRIYALLPAGKWRWDVRRVAACLLDYMDRGYIAAGTHAADAGPACCHYLRVGGASLALLPRKDEEYLPLLVYMESSCLWGWQRMKQRIDEYFGEELKEPSLAAELWLMTKSIHRSGQSFRDWCDPDGPREADDPHIREYKKWAGMD